MSASDSLRTVRCDARPSRRLLCALAHFMLEPVVERTPGYDGAPIAGRVLAAGAQVTLVLGPSGSGKSTVLRELGERLGDRAVRCAHAWPDVPVIDLLPGEPAAAMGLLASAGLAEPALYARTPAQLSDGQRARFAAAEALGRAPGGGVLLLDAFAEPLDALTGESFARALTRTVRRLGVSLVCATTRDATERWLAPDLCVRLALPSADGELTMVRPAPGSRAA